MITIKIWHGAQNAKLFCCFDSFTLIDEFISDNEIANNICSKFQSNNFLMCFFIIMNIKLQSLLCKSISVYIANILLICYNIYTISQSCCRIIYRYANMIMTGTKINLFTCIFCDYVLFIISLKLTDVVLQDTFCVIRT